MTLVRHLIQRGGLLMGGILVCSAFWLIAQEREMPRDELDGLRQIIRESEGRLAALEKQARQSAAASAESRKQRAALDSLIGLLEKREGTIARRMISLRTLRDSLSEVQGRLKKEYVDVARALYRRRLLTPRNSMLLMPEEHRKLALAEVLFTRYAERQVKLASHIRNLTDSLDQRDRQLDQRRTEQLTLLAEQRQEATKLRKLEQRYASDLEQTEESRKRVERFLRQKEREASELEGMIRRAARQKKSEQKNQTNKESKQSTPSTSTTREKQTPKPSVADKSTSAKSKRDEDKSPPQQESKREEPSGRFSPGWPVSSRKIVQGYGERRNQQTNTVTFNPGINIGVSSGATVVASASGTVSLVSWMAGYGTIMIIEHSGGWRTVYANLASASVSEGASVKRGERIGSAGESVDGSYLHFEIWKDQERKDPTGYLR